MPSPDGSSAAMPAHVPSSLPSPPHSQPACNECRGCQSVPRDSPTAAGVEKSQPAGGDAIQETPSRCKLIALGIALSMALFLVSLDGTILATAIPRITNEFGSLSDVAWYGSSYLFAVCALQLMFGKLYTLYSVKWVFLAAVALFEIGSLIVATSPSSAVFIVGRTVSGLGAAGIFGGAIIIIATYVPLRQRPIYNGLLSSIHGVASVAGPLLGGVFTDRTTWRWCFYINLPCGFITVLFLTFIMPSKAPSRPSLSLREQIKQFDLPGTMFLVPSVVCLLLALQWGGARYSWTDARIIVLLVAFALFTVIFCCIQVWQKDQATIPVRILTNKNILGGVWFGACLGAAIFVFSYYLPIWFQAVKGVSATQSGIMNLPSILGLVIFSIIGGGLASALGLFTPLLVASAILCSIASGLLSTLKVDSSIGYWFGYQVLLAAGVGLGGQNVMLTAQVAVPEEDMPLATSVLAFTQMLSSSIFLAIAQNVFQTQLIKYLTAGVPGVSADSIIHGGTTSIRQGVTPEQLPAVLRAYNHAIIDTFYVAVAVSALSIIGPLSMDRLLLKESPKRDSNVKE